jgi:hypothetical protein
MPANFLLLEIADPAVNAFLWRMRETLSGKGKRSPVHVTLRGPYDGTTPRDAMDKARRTLQGDVLRIHGVGRFSNPDGEVVFLHVDSPHLREVWWKPSYPGFQPHISIYRGSDKGLADAVELFLAEENLQINCAEYRLIWHVSKQPGLFSTGEPTVGAMQLLIETSRFDPALLDRLSDRVDQYRQRRRLADWEMQRT